MTIGFKTKGLVARQYGLGDLKTRRGGLNNSFFADGSVKAIGESYCSIQISRSAESAAARGSCGDVQVTA